MLVHRLDTVLARTDPFDLAQALDRYIRAMSAERIRSVVIDARDRIGAYYRGEFIALLEENRAIGRVDSDDLSGEGFVKIVRGARDDDALRRAFSRLLKSNLRAIPLFGATFTEAILANVPADRAVAFGEEQPNTRMRAAAIGGIAVALIFAGAAGEHVIANVRAQNTIAPPLPQPPAPIAAAATPTPLRTQPPKRQIAIVSATSAVATSTPAPAPQPTLAAQPAFTPQPTVAPQPTLTPRPQAKKRTPPPAQGVATIAIPQPTPTPEPTALDTSDMPDVFTDATPIPSQEPAPAEVPNHVSLKTPAPTPKPRSRSWLKRAILHLDPFKPNRP